MAIVCDIAWFNFSFRQSFRQLIGILSVIAFLLGFIAAPKLVYSSPLTSTDGPVLLDLDLPYSDLTSLLQHFVQYPNAFDAIFNRAVESGLLSMPVKVAHRPALLDAIRDKHPSRLRELLETFGYLSSRREARPTALQRQGDVGGGISIAAVGAGAGAAALFALSRQSGSSAQESRGTVKDVDGDGSPYGQDPDDNNACSPSPSAGACVSVDSDGDGYFSNYPTNHSRYDGNDADPCYPGFDLPQCTHDPAPDTGANPRNIEVGARGPLIDRDELRNSDEYRGSGLQDLLPGYNATPFTLAVGADYALSQGWTGRGVKIGIIDDTVDGQHTEFGFFEEGPGMVDCTGCTNYYTHGTHVAGIAAAGYGNGGMTGIAPEATVYGMPIFDDRGSARLNYRDLEDMILTAVADDVRVFNNSWGGSIYDPAALYETAAVYDQAQDEGAVFVWARGNSHSYDPEGNDYARLPAYFPELEEQWVAVTNVVESQPGNGDWVISNRDGGTVVNGQDFNANANECGDAANWCLSAPGTLIYASARDNAPEGSWNFHVDPNGDTYGALSGTSMAAPVVTGAFAVLFQAFPYLESSVLVDLLFATATDLGETGVDEVYGHGLLNLEEALTFQGPIPIIASSNTVTQGGTSAIDSGVVTKLGQTSESFEKAIDGLVVLDAFDRAYRLNPSLLTDDEEDEAPDFRTLLGQSTKTLGHIDLANREATLGSSQTLSAHFREITRGLFFTAGLTNGVKATVGFGLEEQYAAAVTVGQEKFELEAGVILDRRAGRLPTVQTSGAFSTGENAATGYLRAKTRQQLNENWAIEAAGEVGLTRAFGQTEQALTIGNPTAVTAALSAAVERKLGKGSIKGTISMPVTIVHGEVSYLVPVGREENDGVEQEQRTWNLGGLADPDIGLVYDWGGGSIGAETNLGLDRVKGFVTLRF